MAKNSPIERRSLQLIVMTIAVASLLALTAVVAAEGHTASSSSEQEKSASYKNMRLLAQDTLGGFGNGGEGFAMRLTESGRRILYVAHEEGPKCFSVLDVTRPSSPELLSQIDVPNENVRCNSLDLSGDTLAVAHQTGVDQEEAGLRLYSVSDPINPSEVGFFDTSGPYSRGVHFVWFADGRYAHLSTGAPDFEPRRLGSDCNEEACDDQIYMIVDLADPTNPKEVGRWWYPGTREGDTDPAPEPNPGVDSGLRVHNANVFPGRPDRVYIGYLDGGVVILDISDKTQPEEVAILDYVPPSPGFSHTALPLFSRGLLVVTDEAVRDECEDGLKLLWLMDISTETSITPIATAPLPTNTFELCQGGGRFGAHNVYENHPDEPTWQSDQMVVGSFFSGGVRVYDLSDPFHPEEVAYYVPPAPEGSEAGAIQINDVYVDDRGLIYAVDRHAGGLYVLEMELPETVGEGSPPGPGTGATLAQMPETGGPSLLPLVVVALLLSSGLLGLFADVRRWCASKGRTRSSET